MLRLNAPMAMKLAFDGLKTSDYKTRDTTIHDVAKFKTIELSLLLCNDEFIRKLNKDWRDEDHATDVLSMSQHIPGLKLPIVSTINWIRIFSFYMKILVFGVKSFWNFFDYYVLVSAYVR